jgi:hypothetical protein
MPERGRGAPHRSDIAGPVRRNLKNLFVHEENENGVPSIA